MMVMIMMLLMTMMMIIIHFEERTVEHFSTNRGQKSFYHSYRVSERYKSKSENYIWYTADRTAECVLGWGPLILTLPSTLCLRKTSSKKNKGYNKVHFLLPQVIFPNCILVTRTEAKLHLLKQNG